MYTKCTCSCIYQIYILCTLHVHVIICRSYVGSRLWFHETACWQYIVIISFISKITKSVHLSLLSLFVFSSAELESAKLEAEHNCEVRDYVGTNLVIFVVHCCSIDVAGDSWCDCTTLMGCLQPILSLVGSLNPSFFSFVSTSDLIHPFHVWSSSLPLVLTYSDHYQLFQHVAFYTHVIRAMHEMNISCSAILEIFTNCSKRFM